MCLLIVHIDLTDFFGWKSCQFFPDDRTERIFDTSFEHFTSGGHNRILFLFIWFDRKNRLRAACFLCTFHFFFFNDQRNDSRSCQFIPDTHREIAMPGGDHHLPQTVDCNQRFTVDFQQSVCIRNKFDLSFFDIGRMHILTGTDFIQNLRCFIFMPHRVILFPYIQMLFPYGKQHRNVLCGHNMSFAEYCIFGHPPDDLSNIMAEYMPYRIFCFYQFHNILSLLSPVFYHSYMPLL